MRQLPHMNELQEKYTSKGLHIFSLYCQAHTLEQVEETVAKHKIAYPIALEGIWADKYSSPGLPMVWIIGADGKIAFKGGRAYDEPLQKELAKVKYPGLGKVEVASEVEPAAKAFAEGKIANAVKLADAIADGNGPEAAIKDAEFLLLRVEARIRALNQRAEVAESLKDIDAATVAWHELATRYAGCEDAEEAPARLKKLQEDKTAQRERMSRRALLAGMRKLEWDARDVEEPSTNREFREKCVAFFEKFVKENEGTAAAGIAGGYAKRHREWLKASAPAKPPEK